MARIFHPTDFTQASLTAFHHALRLSFDGELTLIHVHPRGNDGDLADFPKVRDTLEHWKSGGLAMANLPKVLKVKAEGNHVAAALDADLRRHPAELVVLACHPREGISAWLKPSISQEFVRRTRAPALFVPEGVSGFVRADGSIKLDTVLVPVAGEPDPQIALDAAHALFAALGHQPKLVVLVHAGLELLSPLPAMPHNANHGLESVTIEAEPVEAISQASAEFRPDLIVMTSAGHDGFLDALRGSTTEQVIRRAPCPVLVEPAPDYGAASAVQEISPHQQVASLGQVSLCMQGEKGPGHGKRDCENDCGDLGLEVRAVGTVGGRRIGRCRSGSLSSILQATA